MLNKIALCIALIAGLVLSLAYQSRAQTATAPATRPEKTGTAVFAAGCFWGVEATFRKVPGVIDVKVGYTGGHTVNPTYALVCKHDTGHAEAVNITYDPAKVSYQQLLEVFFENHDPTTKDRQGPDIGDQYRSAIFFQDAEQEKLAKAEIKKRTDSGEYVGPIVTQVVKAEKFYDAEDYHQNFFAKRGEDFVCHTGNGKKKKGS